MRRLRKEKKAITTNAARATTTIAAVTPRSADWINPVIRSPKR